MRPHAIASLSQISGSGTHGLEFYTHVTYANRSLPCRRLLRDSIREYEKPPATGKTSDAWITSNSQDWCSLPNSEGYSCMEGTCWHSIDMNSCCGPDGCGLPEVEVVSEIDDCTDCGEGGGGPIPPPPPDDPDDPWNPPPDNGGGGGACTTCEPADNPNDDDQLCPLGEIADGNGGCIGENDPLPCVGNPVKNPRIAPQEVSGIGGGQFGFTRSGGNQFHGGIDIANELGNPFYAMYGGTVVSIGYEAEGIGYYVTIQSYINGEYYTHQYGHLQNDGRPINGTQIIAGQVVGIQGLSGNLEGL